MKTLGVLVLFFASLFLLVAAVSDRSREDAFVRIETTVSRPEPLPSAEPPPPPDRTDDQRSALEDVDPGAVQRGMALQAVVSH